MQTPDKVQHAASIIISRLGKPDAGAVGVVLGTGLGEWAARLERDTLPYSDIPGFPASTVQSHGGEMLAGAIGGRRVYCLSGRFHLYEGYDSSEVTIGVRALARAGVNRFILTNAAGALNPLFSPGSLMVLTDHINHTGFSPLRGPNVDEWGPRFPDMCSVYSPSMRRAALDAARDIGLRLERGVYIQVPGPQMETPAETRAYRMLGADAIGMSTALEAIALHHMGVEILGLSCLTNRNLPDCMEPAPIDQVVARARAAGDDLAALLENLIPRL
ncbi:purine-nucleoside phosphorylase [Desulfohalovibrio reitneri]|uniref:purine-nucleoside phosphorylase n=1 Tax=Desulfohalovibrio reitneri TaxID=1307759 RepID=UPI0004A6C756|nr:purine-nucleoside phosphorylase [Desulfohalovibrio reitneri]